VVLMMGLRETSALCILESPYCLGDLKQCDYSCSASSFGSEVLTTIVINMYSKEDSYFKKYP